MRRFVRSCSIGVALLVLVARGEALTRHVDDMCSQPKMNTNKWQSRESVAGMTILLPPGYVESGKSTMYSTMDSHYYVNGEHRAIGVGSGSGPEFLHHSIVSESGECETVIADRHVTITLYRWVNEDARLSASGDAGEHFAAIARYYASGSMREVYVELFSNAPSDLKYFRQLFWTVSFAGASVASAAPQTPTTPTTHASAPASPAASPAGAGSAPAPTCAPTPGLPTTDALVDTSVVRMLIASAAPIPHGSETMALQFAASGDLSGMSIAQSDLPDAAQKELSSVVATNLKPHDAHAPSTLLLRIDSSDAGHAYTERPVTSCAH
jgi:hypothetical protein